MKRKVQHSKKPRRTRLSAQALESRKLMAADLGVDPVPSLDLSKFEAFREGVFADVASLNVENRGIQPNTDFDLNLDLDFDLDLSFVDVDFTPVDLTALNVVTPSPNFAFDSATFVGNGIFASGTASATGPNAFAEVSIDVFGSGVSVSGFASAGTGTFSFGTPSVSVSSSSTVTSSRSSSFSSSIDVVRDRSFSIDVFDGIDATSINVSI
ncbi:MAG: hypothetical protein AAF802_05840 [Planctomycetota bacterium]